MEIAPDLVRRLKRLRLGGLVPTLPDPIGNEDPDPSNLARWLCRRHPRSREASEGEAADEGSPVHQ